MSNAVPPVWVRAEPGHCHAPGHPGGTWTSTVRFEPPARETLAGKLADWVRTLRVRNRSVRIESVAPSLVSSALQESQPLLESGGLIDPVTSEIGLLLPAAGSLLAVRDLGVALCGKRDASRAMWALRPGSELAAATLGECRLSPELAARKAALKQARTRLEVPADASLPLHIGRHRARISHEGAAAPAQDAAPTASTSRLDAALVDIERQRDRMIAMHCADYLGHVEAACRGVHADRLLAGSVLACVRDVGVDVPSVGYDAASVMGAIGDGPLGVLLAAGDVPSYGLGAAAGLAQVACGAVEVHQACHERKLLDHLDTLVARNIANLGDDPVRSERVTSPFARRVMDLFQRNRRQALLRTWQRSAWAWLRIAYGMLSFAASATGTGVLLLLGAAALAGTAGMVLVGVGAVVGFSWLGFTGYKMLTRASNAAALRNECESLSQALERSAAVGLAAPSLAQCTLAQLEALPHKFPLLKDNRYFQAAVLAKRLVIDPDDRYRGKHARVETATILQALGMPKVWTTMLKRAPFELAHRFIHGYLNQDMAVLVLDRKEVEAGTSAMGAAASADVRDAGRRS